MFIIKLASLKYLGWVRNRIPGRRRSSSLTLQLHMISLNATHVWWLKFHVSKFWSIYDHIYLNMVIEIKYCQRNPCLTTSWIQDGGSSTSSRMSLSSSSPVWGTLALQTKLFDFDFIYFKGLLFVEILTPMLTCKCKFLHPLFPPLWRAIRPSRWHILSLKMHRLLWHRAVTPPESFTARKRHILRKLLILLPLLAWLTYFCISRRSFATWTQYNTTNLVNIYTFL